MEFYLPFARDTEEAVKVLEVIAMSIGHPAPPPGDMIHTVYYIHDGIQMIATVGEDIDPYYQEANPTVIAIFPPLHDGDSIRICLEDRGAISGEPIYIRGDNHYMTFRERVLM
jgi:hypothetical protein